MLAVKYHDLILKSTGLESDGVVVYEPKELVRLGIKYLENESELNHMMLVVKSIWLMFIKEENYKVNNNLL